MSEKVILFLVIEGNGNKGCGGSGGKDQSQTRLLEDEARLFFNRWYNPSINKEFSKIETYLICSSNRPPCDNFIKEISENFPLVHYIHAPHDVADTFPAGWFNTPLAGKWLEENIEFDKAIHLDLDMILLKKFNRKYLDFSDGDIANCAIYHPEFPDDLTHMHGLEKRFVTCFIVSTKAGLFYSKWWDIQYELQLEYEKKYKDNLIASNETLWWQYCNLEEHAVDVMYFTNGESINQIEYCQFGNTNGYGSIEDNIDHINELNFLHCHVDGNWKEQIEQYASLKVQQLMSKN